MLAEHVRSVSEISPTVAFASTAAMIGGTRFGRLARSLRTASSAARQAPRLAGAHRVPRAACCTRSISGSMRNVGIVGASSV